MWWSWGQEPGKRKQEELQSMRIHRVSFGLLLSFLMICGLTHSDAFSQSVVLGVKGGLSIPNLKGGDTPQSEGYTSRLAPTFGAFISFEFDSPFAIRGEVLFAGQGGQRNGMQPIFAENLAGLPVPLGMDLYADFENETILNYLEIPVLACYSFIRDKSGFDVYVDAGPYLGILLNAEVVTSGTSTIYLDKAGTMPLEINDYPLPPQNFDNKVDIADKLNDINVGIAGGVGSNYTFGRHQLTIDLRGSYGFIPIQADKENGSNYTGSVYITLGYGYSI
ncbi:porin family protein [Candidatus Eisenbacteria bacterium]|uniref:Porin family protein n=1 Tax=Eiseniibacteriota bacterium TaxID=2212470 RepID=A0ABV6YNH2_UNCEI